MDLSHTRQVSTLLGIVTIIFLYIYIYIYPPSTLFSKIGVPLPRRRHTLVTHISIYIYKFRNIRRTTPFTHTHVKMWDYHFLYTHSPIMFTTTTTRILVFPSFTLQSCVHYYYCRWWMAEWHREPWCNPPYWLGRVVACCCCCCYY